MVALFLLKGEGVSRQVGKGALGTYGGATAGSDEELGGVASFPLEINSALEPLGWGVGFLKSCLGSSDLFQSHAHFSM